MTIQNPFGVYVDDGFPPPAAPPGPCPGPLAGKNHRGDDISNTPNLSLEQCQAKCEQVRESTHRPLTAFLLQNLRASVGTSLPLASEAGPASP